MEGSKKSSFSLFLICVVLITIAGTTGYISKNFIPKEIDTAELNRSIETPKTEKAIETPKTEKATETTTQKETLDKQMEVLQSSLGTAINIIQEAPRFIFLMGSKLLSAHVEESTESNSNIYSVVDQKKN